MGIRRRAAAEDAQLGGADIGDIMRCTGRDTYRIPSLHRGRLRAQRHLSFPGNDLVNLLARAMPVELCRYADGEYRLRKTLVGIAVDGRVHQLADNGAVLCDKWFDVGVVGFHGLTPSVSCRRASQRPRG